MPNITNELMEFLARNPAVQNGEKTFRTADVFPRPATKVSLGWLGKHDVRDKRNILAEHRDKSNSIRQFLEALVSLGYVEREGKINDFHFRLRPGTYEFLKERLQTSSTAS
jgi:hypothetical protein